MTPLFLLSRRSNNGSNNARDNEETEVEGTEGAEGSKLKSLVTTQEFVSTFSQRFTCDIDLDPFKSGARLSVHLSADHSDHKWRLEVENLTRENFQVRLDPIEGIVGQYATNAQVFVSIARIDDVDDPPLPIASKLWRVAAIPWTSNSSFSFDVSNGDVLCSKNPDKPLTSHNYPRSYRVVLEYKGNGPQPSIPSGREAAIARRMSGQHLFSVNPELELGLILSLALALSLSPGPNGVCLSFSRDVKIWVDSKQLCALSPFFEDCLSSGFSEGQAQVDVGNSNEMNGEGETSSRKGKTIDDFDDFDDSDDESDQTLKKDGKVSVAESPSHSFRTIPISQTAFVTYKATLIWQQTGFIRFAPLTSSFLCMTSKDPVSVEEVKKRQQDETRRIAESDPSLPYPVSSKSLYRLAHFLDIPALKELAILAFSQRLTPQGSIYEFLSHEASCYPEIRKTALDYVVKHSQKVVQSPGYTHTLDLATTSDVGYASLFASLFEALSSSAAARSDEISRESLLLGLWLVFD